MDSAQGFSPILKWFSRQSPKIHISVPPDIIAKADEVYSPENNTFCKLEGRQHLKNEQYLFLFFSVFAFS